MWNRQTHRRVMGMHGGCTTSRRMAACGAVLAASLSALVWAAAPAVAATGGTVSAPTDSSGYSFFLVDGPATVTATARWGPDWSAQPGRTQSDPFLIEVPFNGGNGCDHVWKHPENRMVSLLLDPGDQFDTAEGTLTVPAGKSIAIAGSDCFFGDNFHAHVIVDWRVVDPNNPPDCSAVAPSATSLWPPRHQLVEVSLAGAVDTDGDDVTIAITGVTQDEPLNGLGDGDTSPDAQVGSASNKVLLRAERAGGGDGRAYRVAYTASDPHGATCSGVVTVGVPHNQGPKGATVDSGLVVNSFGP